MRPRANGLLVVLALALVAAAPLEAASAQRYGAGAGGQQRRPLTSVDGARTNGGGNALRRDPITRVRVLTPEERVRVRLAVIARAQRVLGNSRASATDLRAAGVEASTAFHSMAEALEQRGDRTGAAAAFTNAAASRWGRNDVDMRFRSQAFVRAARMQSASGDRRGAAVSFRRAAEALDRVGTEQDQLRAASLYADEAGIHGELGDTRAHADALVGSAEAMTRAGNIVTASYQAFDRGAPSTWPESEHVLRARAHDHLSSAGGTRATANREYRAAGLSWLAARRATNNPRTQLPELAPTPVASP